ncbi:uncharacterized protein LOC134527803 [Bacillus rossius redtenbacheri]|uniref:uncharacterized protein LOC134527803 n=1 Tax=Bacillus rossius redtenbacheri TaxID=93214 RepID=UPI002FDEA8A7
MNCVALFIAVCATGFTVCGTTRGYMAGVPQLADLQSGISQCNCQYGTSLNLYSARYNYPSRLMALNASDIKHGVVRDATKLRSVRARMRTTCDTLCDSTQSHNAWDVVKQPSQLTAGLTSGTMMHRNRDGRAANRFRTSFCSTWLKFLRCFEVLPWWLVFAFRGPEMQPRHVPATQ